jgi:hypothetical protein
MMGLGTQDAQVPAALGQQPQRGGTLGVHEARARGPERSSAYRAGVRWGRSVDVAGRQQPETGPGSGRT